MTPHVPWWRTLGDRPLHLDTPGARGTRRRVARVFATINRRQRRRDAELWTDLGGEA